MVESNLKQQYKLDQKPRLQKQNLMMHVNTSHKTIQTILVKTGSHFTEKLSSGFPSDVLRLLCLSVAFYLAELSPTTLSSSLHICNRRFALYISCYLCLRVFFSFFKALTGSIVHSLCILLSQLLNGTTEKLAICLS